MSKDRKKGEKIVTDSQERAFWRVHRPPPGCVSVMEQIPIKIGGSFSTKKKRSSEDLRREVNTIQIYLYRTVWSNNIFIIYYNPFYTQLSIKNRVTCNIMYNRTPDN